MMLHCVIVRFEDVSMSLYEVNHLYSHHFDPRAKHQKLKSGTDQSPGEKKPETEAEPSNNLERTYQTHTHAMKRSPIHVFPNMLIIPRFMRINTICFWLCFLCLVTSFCFSQYPMGLQIQTLSQPIRCLGRRAGSYCASQCICLCINSQMYFSKCCADTVRVVFLCVFMSRYLEEVGYSDTILDMRSKRVRSLLGRNSPEANGPPPSEPPAEPEPRGGGESLLVRQIEEQIKRLEQHAFLHQ